MNDALWIAGHLALIFITCCWLANGFAEWLVRRVMHD
jgi:hypothetical protein